MLDGIRRWLARRRKPRLQRYLDDEPDRAEAERRRFDARTQARRPAGSGRRTGYDNGDTGQL